MERWDDESLLTDSKLCNRLQRSVLSVRATQTQSGLVSQGHSAVRHWPAGKSVLTDPPSPPSKTGEREAGKRHSQKFPLRNLSSGVKVLLCVRDHLLSGLNFTHADQHARRSAWRKTWHEACDGPNAVSRSTFRLSSPGEPETYR